ncbi:MAG: hypothetical protein UW41_C0010G0034 [Candidatus Collierbacteria bacterium GW2011_GWC2_44_18]|uniref:Uncharacterized protein n=2 Tax=Microgenomates group TaxID=1794810 RepID=A0A0G1M6H3_9BACT|nr:MAG: hypothetical protein UW41_C0010G0034 [Candidatus Collierbacteria bacterium GW2011_GWC2_44_18]KKT67514.1 MAG: hypothetical protein UW60_C0005G0028 [Candidatus Woesebacteria bacterium GW2011_GWA2_44_33]
MSFRTEYYSTSVNRDILLDLFLGRGNLIIHVGGQTTTIQRIYDLNLHRDLNDGELAGVKIEGDSDEPRITEVDGKATVKLFNHNQDIFILDLELHLQDAWE